MVKNKKAIIIKKYFGAITLMSSLQIVTFGCYFKSIVWRNAGTSRHQRHNNLCQKSSKNYTVISNERRCKNPQKNTSKQNPES